MKIFKKDFKKDELLKKIGDIEQLGGIKLYEFSDGLRKGVRAADFESPCGLDMTILIDRGLDISKLSYKAIPINWKSATRESSAIYYESRGDEWLRSFFGGLLTTCGITYMGDPCIDDEEIGLHGRISNLPAENVCTGGEWLDDNYKMWISGKVREVKTLGDKLELTRRITTWMDRPVVILEDTIENIGTKVSPLMVLYHINIGFPLLDRNSRLYEKNTHVFTLDEESKKGIKDYMNFTEPVDHYKEQVFYHDIKEAPDGNCIIAFINEEFNDGNGLGLIIKYSKETLPYLVQWKQLGGGEYVCGLEPSNSFVRGRRIEKSEDRVRYIKPGEKQYFRLEFEVLESKKEIDKIKSELS